MKSSALLACLTLFACDAGRQPAPQRATNNADNPNPSSAKPETSPSFRVHGVAADDVLNIRASAGIHAAIVGTAPPNATGLEATGRTQVVGAVTWRELRFHGTLGWVNERFLAAERAEPPRDTTNARLPISLLCSGTEPFWSLELNPDATARCSEMGKDPLALKIANHSGNSAGTSHSLDVISLTGEVFLHVEIKHTAQCSDGMSDLIYPFAIHAKGPARDLNGCCRRPPAKH